MHQKTTSEERLRLYNLSLTEIISSSPHPHLLIQKSVPQQQLCKKWCDSVIKEVCQRKSVRMKFDVSEKTHFCNDGDGYIFLLYSSKMCIKIIIWLWGSLTLLGDIAACWYFLSKWLRKWDAYFLGYLINLPQSLCPFCPYPVWVVKLWEACSNFSANERLCFLLSLPRSSVCSDLYSSHQKVLSLITDFPTSCVIWPWDNTWRRKLAIDFFIFFCSLCKDFNMGWWLWSF